MSGKRGPQQSPENSVKKFWEKVDQSRGPFGCWPWMASTKEKGYGQTYFLGKNKRAHRLAYELHYGEPAGDKLVCHLCDNPPCCNPWHLTLATAKENTADMIGKGRANFYNNLPNLRKSA